MSTLHIVGGGLAGMTVAWEMAQARNAGFDRFEEIVLYESSYRLGGKAGSESTRTVYDENGRSKPWNEKTAMPDQIEQTFKWSDHGYHLFPVWYRNVIEIMGEVGVDYDRIVVEGEKFVQIPRAVAVDKLNPPDGRQPFVTETLLTRSKKMLGTKVPGLGVVDAPTHKDTLIAGKTDSLFPMIMMICTLPALINEADVTLRKHSIKSFLNWRFPLVGFLALPSYESLVLKALSAEASEMSAYALAKMFRRWTYPAKSLVGHSWSSLDASLQTAFIEPFQQALHHAGVDIKPDHALEELFTASGSVTCLHFKDRGMVTVEEGDHVVSAVPPNVLAQVSSSPLREVAASLAKEMSTFSGVDVYFPKAAGVPRQHFGFRIDPKKFGATAYDIRPVWPDTDLAYTDDPMVLQLVVPQVDGLGIQGEDVTERDLIRHVRHYLDETFTFQQTRWFVNVNRESPLSLANVTAYDAREALPDIGRLSLAGDFMDSSIEVPSMEGAVGNGRRVAAELLGQDRKQGDPDVPQRVWVALMAVVGWILAYVVALVSGLYLVPRWIYRWIKARVSGGSSDSSSATSGRPHASP